MNVTPIYRAPREAAVDLDVLPLIVQIAGAGAAWAWHRFCITANDRREVTLTDRELAAIFAWDRSTATKHRRKLRHCGLLRRVRGHGKGSPEVVCLPTETISRVREYQEELLPLDDDEQDVPALRLAEPEVTCVTSDRACEVTSVTFPCHEVTDVTLNAPSEVTNVTSSRVGEVDPKDSKKESAASCDDQEAKALRAKLCEVAGAKSLSFWLHNVPVARSGDVLQVRCSNEFQVATFERRRTIGKTLWMAAKAIGFNRVNVECDPTLAPPNLPPARESQPRPGPPSARRLLSTNQPTLLSETLLESKITTNQPTTGDRPPDEPASRSGGNRGQPTNAAGRGIRASPEGASADAKAIVSEAQAIYRRLGDEGLYRWYALSLAFLKLCDGRESDVESLIGDAEAQGMGQPKRMFKNHKLPLPDFARVKNRLTRLGVPWTKFWEGRQDDEEKPSKL